MIIDKKEKYIEYKIHKLDKGVFLCIYENNEIEVIGNKLSLPIRTNKSGTRFVIEGNKVYFIEKYLNKNINYLYEII